METFNFRHQILTLGYKKETNTLQFLAKVFVINPRVHHQDFEHFITTFITFEVSMFLPKV